MKLSPGLGCHGAFRVTMALAFKAAVSQGVSKALGIEYHLHCSWRPQSSGKVEKANDIIKRHLDLGLELMVFYLTFIKYGMLFG